MKKSGVDNIKCFNFSLSGCLKLKHQPEQFPIKLDLAAQSLFTLSLSKNLMIHM